MGIISLVCGIVGLVMSFIIPTRWIALILGVIAIIFAAIAMKKTPEKKGMGIAGLVTGIIAVVISIIVIITCASAKSAVEDALGGVDLDELQQQIEDQLNQ